MYSHDTVVIFKFLRVSSTRTILLIVSSDKNNGKKITTSWGDYHITAK